MKSWNWLESSFMPIILGLMQATWVYAGLQILAVGVYQAPALFPWWLVAGVWLVAFWLTRLVLALAWPLHVQQVVVAGAGILAIVIVLGQHFGCAPCGLWHTGPTDQGIVTPRLLAAVVVVWLWGRGILTGRAGVAYDQVYRAFTNGVAMWVILAALAYGGLKALPATFTGLLLAFFLTGLMALALTGLLATSRQEKRDTGLSLPVNRYWVLLTGAATVVIILLALLLTAVLTPETAASILRHLDPILAFLGQVLLLLLMAVAYLFFLVIGPLINWLRQMAGDVAVNPQAPPDFSAWQQQIENRTVETALPAWVAPATRAGLLAGGLLLAGLLFAFALRRLSVAGDEGIESEREMVGSYDLFKAQLADLIKRWRSRQPVMEPFLPLDDVGARRAIRAIYRQFLAKAGEAGRGRAPGDTPHEYLATFETEAPKRTFAWQTLTDRYTAARYSDLTLAETAVAEAETAWEAIAAKLSDQRKERGE